MPSIEPHGPNPSVINSKQKNATGRSVLQSVVRNNFRDVILVTERYLVKKSFTCWVKTSRPMSLMASVRGSCLGQAWTQF